MEVNRVTRRPVERPRVIVTCNSNGGAADHRCRCLYPQIRRWCVLDAYLFIHMIVGIH